MSTVKTFQGIDDEGKPSSRVLRPPGGGSNHIFGGCEEPQKASNQYQRSSPFATDDSAAAPSGGRRHTGPTGAAAAPFASEMAPAPQAQQPAAPRRSNGGNPIAPEPANQPSQPANRAPATNPLVGESEKATPPAQNIHTSTKVRQPPGGASSGLW